MKKIPDKIAENRTLTGLYYALLGAAGAAVLAVVFGLITDHSLSGFWHSFGFLWLICGAPFAVMGLIHFMVPQLDGKEFRYGMAFYYGGAFLARFLLWLKGGAIVAAFVIAGLLCWIHWLREELSKHNVAAK